MQNSLARALMVLGFVMVLLGIYSALQSASAGGPSTTQSLTVGSFGMFLLVLALVFRHQRRR